MKEELDEYPCPECGEMRDVEKMCNPNGTCDSCQEEEFDISEVVCPNCDSEAVGMDGDTLECFSCSHEWNPKK